MDVQAVVLETLGRAVSQDLAVLKEAEAKLQEWETQPGFYSLLKDIFCNQSIDISLRLMAILLCKNGVERYWRPNAPNAISENEKAVIRESFISNFHIPEKQLAAHLSVVVSRIARTYLDVRVGRRQRDKTLPSNIPTDLVEEERVAGEWWTRSHESSACRHDWPGQWSSLMPTLMSGVDSEDQLSQRVALLTLHQVVKGLSSRRLLPDRRLFQEFTSSVFPFIRQVWDTHTEVFFTKLAPEQAQNEEDFKSLELSLLSLKILDKLVIHGFKEPHKSNEVQLFLPSLFLRLKNMATFRPLLKCATCETLASKYIVKGTNLLLGLLEHHPFSFVDQISTALEFAVFFAFSPPAQPCLFERFLIQCFNLIKSILLCQEYKPSKLPDDNKDPQAVRAHQLKESFFTETMLAEICHRLITRYFLLTPRDLELWDSDPEAFATDEVGESWKYALRPSSETLFATLFHEYRVQLTPVIVELVREHQPPVSPFDMSAILLKDAVYNAVGIGSFDLYDVINLDEWYKTSLKSEMSVLETNYRIIRRRVAWLLGAWTGMSSELYPSVYRDMIGLLRPEEDLVVRLSAANTIRSVLDDFEFNLDSFLEFLEPIFLSLFDLLKQANESDTKMKVLNVLYFIIERVGLSMEPYYQRLVGYLPLLWQESQGHSMLRCAVVATLVHLVRAIGKINESEEVANFILSVISVSTDTAEDSHIYLLEEGLELWYCVLGHTPPNSASLPPLIQLFRNIPPLLENNSEHLKLCCSVITAYVMLAPHEILQIYGETLIRLFADLLTDMRSEGIVHIMRLLEIFLKVNATLSCSLLKPLLPNIFENIYKDEELPAMMGLYLSILSRVLLTSQQVFIETVTKVSEGVWKSPDEVLSKIMDVWLKKMPLISQSEKKKLLALALSSLVIANFRFVYDKFQGIVLAVTEVLNDITRIDETGALIDCLVYSSGEQDEKGSCNTEHELRKWELALRDPVHTTVLADYFTTQILNLKRDVGPNDFEKFLSTLDESTLTMAREYVPL